MPDIRIRPKNQVTLPASIVSAAGLRENDALSASYVNGVITLVPKARSSRKDNLMDYAGMAGDRYGRTGKQIDTSIAKLRAEWTR
ncbi:MAG TPA: AbrB/MazE/SpoVT family DNA-binding domain-containing protein [Rhodanobacteraceae bacterium]